MACSTETLAIILTLIFLQAMPPAESEVSPLEKTEPGSSCINTECIGIAYRIRKSLNVSVDPCQDFYQFVCGGFLDKTRIPDDKSEASTLASQDDLIDEQARILLEEKSDSDWDLFKKIKAHYRDCLDERKKEELGLKPMQDILDLIGGWPVVTGEPNPNHWTDLVAVLTDLGFDSYEHLLGIFVDVSPLDTSRFDLYLDKPDFGYSQEYLTGVFGFLDKKEYLEKMVQVAERFGAATGVARAQMEDVFALEADLAQTALKKLERRNETLLHNPRTLGQLNQGRKVNYTSWINRVGNFVPALRDEDTVIVRDLQLFDKFELFLGKGLRMRGQKGNNEILSYYALPCGRSVVN